ncbi:PREDICTED: SPARC-related modular calcium-binding protein 1 [Thamnophis sirtalis]|uniref:SPARC-related modular calcium-binding protein 1 n=1 Tax=Thamnophis sirtalis TaxID=35019 RepID=A0A6I9XP25_9SAUR|nr:PREDICTED: SPARC-related modular calcium-binding protein 1 [Thamnophis sirtalis]
MRRRWCTCTDKVRACKRIHIFKPVEKFLISDHDQDPQCNLQCSRSAAKPLCASDGRTYESMCDYQRAKCKDSNLNVAHRGRCKDAGQSKCRLERTQALDQVKKPQEAVFVPECHEDGSFTQKINSCDQERQSALEEAKQNPREGIVIPECAPGGLYKPVQCHQSTGYCWCVLVDTGRPLPGTSTRYETPVCESDARSRSPEIDDPFKDRELPGCPEGKKVEFITSLLDALTTDMVQAINSAAPAGGGRFSEPDPSHTLEERVVHWYFSQLDNNNSSDINKREMKPFKRYVKKKAKPKKCTRRFTDYCDLNKDKSISLQELKGCLGVRKEEGSIGSFPHGKRQGVNPFIGRLV